MTVAVKVEKRKRYRELNDTEQQIAHTVGSRVTELREQMDISQGELGKRAGINQTTISLIETGKQLPNINSLVKLSEVFDTDLVIALKPKGEVTTAEGFANALLHNLNTLDRFRNVKGTEEIFAGLEDFKNSIRSLMITQKEE